MSTRRLILAALLCALAILVAGGVQLVRIAGNRDNPFEPLTVGQPADVGGSVASVVSADVDDDVVLLRVRVEASPSAAAPDMAAAWRLQVGGEPQPAVEAPIDEAPCPTGEVPAGETVECSLAFERAKGTPFARYDVGGETALWSLAD